MRKAILIGMALIVMLNLTGCVMVQDVMYDMGVNVDFNDYEEDIVAWKDDALNTIDKTLADGAQQVGEWSESIVADMNNTFNSIFNDKKEVEKAQAEKEASKENASNINQQKPSIIIPVLEITTYSSGKYFKPLLREVTMEKNEVLDIIVWDDENNEEYRGNEYVLVFKCHNGDIQFYNKKLSVFSDYGYATLDLKHSKNGNIIDRISVWGSGIRSEGFSGTTQITSKRIKLDSFQKYAKADSWFGDKGAILNNHVSVFNFNANLNFDQPKKYKEGYYTISFDAYNSMNVVYGVSAYDEYGVKIGKTKLIGGYAENFSLVNELIEGVSLVGEGIFQLKLLQVFKGETEFKHEKTHVEFVVPTGGYIVFEEMMTNEDVLWTNIACAVIQIVDALEADGKILSPIKTGNCYVRTDIFADNLKELLSLQDIKKIVSDYAAKKNIDSFIKGISSNQKYIDCLQQSLSSSIFEIGEEIIYATEDELLKLGAAPLYYISNGTDAVVKNLQLGHQLSAIYNSLVKGESYLTFNRIEIPTRN